MDYNIWVSSLKRRLLNNKKVVLTDVRFPNELQMVKDLGGILVWVKRGPLPEWYDCAIKANDFYSEKLFQYPRKSVDHMINKYKVHESEWKWVGWKFDYIMEKVMKQLLTNNVLLKQNVSGRINMKKKTILQKMKKKMKTIIKFFQC